MTQRVKDPGPSHDAPRQGRGTSGKPAAPRLAYHGLCPLSRPIPWHGSCIARSKGRAHGAVRHGPARTLDKLLLAWYRPRRTWPGLTSTEHLGPSSPILVPWKPTFDTPNQLLTLCIISSVLICHVQSIKSCIRNDPRASNAFVFVARYAICVVAINCISMGLIMPLIGLGVSPLDTLVYINVVSLWN